VPCHRVIGSTGKLTGYAGGLWRKEWLLNHEKSVIFGKQTRTFLKLNGNGKNVNVINWFEIPVTDFSRAKNFYEQSCPLR